MFNDPFPISQMFTPTRRKSGQCTPFSVTPTVIIRSPTHAPLPLVSSKHQSLLPLRPTILTVQGGKLRTLTQFFMTAMARAIDSLTAEIPSPNLSKSSLPMNLSTVMTKPAYLTRIRSSHSNLQDQTLPPQQIPKTHVHTTLPLQRRAPRYLQKASWVICKFEKYMLSYLLRPSSRNSANHHVPSIAEAASGQLSNKIKFKTPVPLVLQTWTVVYTKQRGVMLIER